VSLDMGVYTIFPNMYVVLVAGSGRCRKSTAINQAENIIREIDTAPNLLSQRITPEALIDSLRVVERGGEDNAVLRETAEGFVIADELVTFLNRKAYDNDLGSMLIQFYDCKDKYVYKTKSRGEEVLNRTCLGLLGGSTVDWLRTAIPEEAIGGGLTSRIIFVYVDKPSPPIAITTFSKEKQRLKESLIRSLAQISTLEGEVTMEPEGWEWYKTEYERFYGQSDFYDQQSLSGYASRRHVHLLKIAIVFSASERADLVVTPHHLRGAKALLETSETHMQKVLALVSSNEAGSMTKHVQEVIQSRTEITRSELLRMLNHRLSAKELQETIDTLISSGVVRQNSDGRTIYYTPA
jgi:hypothetical protein